MTKIHELLAIERGTADRARDAMTAFLDLVESSDKPFTGLVKSYQPYDEGERGEPVKTSLPAFNVGDEFEKALAFLQQWSTASARKDEANACAYADVILDGDVCVGRLPATALLTMAARFTKLLTVAKAIPTNSASESWKWNNDEGWYEHSTQHTRTQQVARVIKKAEATEHHPEQADVWMQDVSVGTVTATALSTMWPAHRKRDLIAKINEVIEALTGARKRANDTDIEEQKPIYEALFDYIRPESVPLTFR
jgi:pterin-4a-carbinolamine dehydratase